MPEYAVCNHTTIHDLYTQQARRWQQQEIGYQSILPVTEQALAMLPAIESSAIELPWYASHACDDRACQIVLWVDPQLIYFRGHFVDAPILPGVAQVHWAIDAATRAFNPTGRFSGIGRLKFKAPTQPHSWLNLELQKEQNHIDFTFRDAQQVRTEGRLLFHG
ncbi:MAG: hypothetical protein RIC89_14520 [Pseudomonadales bacterium]